MIIAICIYVVICLLSWRRIGRWLLDGGSVGGGGEAVGFVLATTIAAVLVVVWLGPWLIHKAIGGDYDTLVKRLVGESKQDKLKRQQDRVAKLTKSNQKLEEELGIS